MAGGKTVAAGRVTTGSGGEGGRKGKTNGDGDGGRVEGDIGRAVVGRVAVRLKTVGRELVEG